jgi:hypothetical protein
MKIFKELNKLGYKHYTENTVEELDDLPLDSEERIIEQTLVLRWFRKNRHLKFFIKEDDFRENVYEYGIKEVINITGFKTYEQAELECLKKLIELVYEKKIKK